MLPPNLNRKSKRRKKLRKRNNDRLMKLIVGLGNPEPKYERTRHNVGFLVLDALYQNKWTKGKGPFQINQVPFQGGEVTLAKPTVYMNESGVSVKALCDCFQVLPSDCLIVVDDVNLPLGKIRFRSSGSSGGHHGLESVIAELGTSEFPRLRVGVAVGDLSGQDLVNYVLGHFSKEEWDQLQPQIKEARDACLKWLK